MMWWGFGAWGFGEAEVLGPRHVGSHAFLDHPDARVFVRENFGSKLPAVIIRPPLRRRHQIMIFRRAVGDHLTKLFDFRGSEFS